ncbi:MAG: hypothetical protein ABIQ40_19835 [Bacteroidia bacterium]
MALHDWLMPRENVHYSSADMVEYGGTELKFHITDQRIVLHNKKGLIFKKEAIVTERLEDVITMAYKEEGVLFMKKGVLQIQTPNKVMDFKGKPESIKVIWHNLQQYVKR